MNFTQEYYFGNGSRDPNRPRKVVFYGRVSTQHEAQMDALSNQMQWYEDQARFHPNWFVVDRYIDEGISGTSAKKRPAFMRMLEDAQSHKFDLIVTREVCRFARNTVDTLEITRQLKSIGVEVFFVNDSIMTMQGDGELRLSIMATIAQEESRKISERVRAGQDTSRKKGVLYGNGNIVGYDRVGSTYVINEEQAETVRIIYRLYSQGMGEKRIVNELTRLGRKDSTGNVNWSCSKVSRMLRNATYMGYIGYNKSTVTDYLAKTRLSNLDESTYTYVKGDFEPIVSEELWHKCERIRKDRISVRQMPNGETRRKGVRDSRVLWVRKLRCRCGCSFRKFNWRTLKNGTQVVGFQCTRRTANPSKSFVETHGLSEQNFCDAISVGQWKLEMMAKLIFQQVWGDSKPAILRACEMVEACSKTKQMDARQQKMQLAQKKSALQQRKLRLNQMRADGDLELAEYRKLMSATKRDLRELEEHLDSPLPEDKPSVDMKAIRRALEKVVDTDAPTIADELIEEFVEVVTPVENYRYRWKLNFGEPKQKAERTDMMAVTAEPILTFTVNYETAYEFRKSVGLPLMQFYRSAWHDLVVEVYL